MICRSINTFDFAHFYDPTRSYWWIQFNVNCGRWWMVLFWDKKIHVWIKRNRLPIKSLTKTNNFQVRLNSIKIYTRIVHTQNQRHCIFSSGGQLWHKVCKKEDSEHLLKTIKSRYECKASWDPDYYLSIKLTMPNYVKQALIQFQHVLEQK